MMKNAKVTKADPTMVFAATVQEIQARLDLLREEADCFLGVDPDAVNWGHVGSAAHLLSIIKEATCFLGLENEEA